MIENETENLDTYKEIIDEWPDYEFAATMKDCANNNLDDTYKKYLNEINEIGVDEEGRETKDIENEGVM